MENVGINLLNAVKNELLPIIFEINNAHNYDLVASVDFSRYQVAVRIWVFGGAEKPNGETVINLELEEINGKIEVNKKYSCWCPKNIETYADLIPELKKCLAKDYAKV
jgi:hypothetical protein